MGMDVFHDIGDIFDDLFGGDSESEEEEEEDSEENEAKLTEAVESEKMY